jgi:hypothetical protein
MNPVIDIFKYFIPETRLMTMLYFKRCYRPIMFKHSKINNDFTSWWFHVTQLINCFKKKKQSGTTGVYISFRLISSSTRQE